MTCQQKHFDLDRSFSTGLHSSLPREKEKNITKGKRKNCVHERKGSPLPMDVV